MSVDESNSPTGTTFDVEATNTTTSDESSDSSTTTGGLPSQFRAAPRLQQQFNARPSTTTSASPYEALLDQVTALQTDLSKTFSVCQQLRSENDSLSENYYRIKEDHTALREKYSDTRRRFYDEQKIRMEVEQNHDSIVRSWKLQLDQRAEEFMELQQQMAPPRDLDLLRIKIQEELEIPHQEKVSRLEREGNKYREMFYNVRREHELLRTEFEQFSIDQGKREESVHEAHAIVVEQLRLKISQAQAAKDDTVHIDEIRRLERQVNECNVRIESLDAENDDLRRAKEAATVSRDQAHLKVGRENMELLASVKTLEARAQNAEAHASSLSVQVERSGRRVSEQQKRIADIDHALSASRHEIEKRDIERTDEQNAHAETIVAINEECSLKIDTITKERDAALKKIRDLQWELQTAAATVENSGLSADAAIADVRKEMKKSEERYTNENMQQEKEMEEANNDRKRMVDETKELEKLLEQEREAHSTSKRSGAAEVERIRQRMIQLAEAHKSEQLQSQEHVQEHAELQVEYNQLRNEHRELRAKEQVSGRGNEKRQEGGVGWGVCVGVVWVSRCLTRVFFSFFLWCVRVGCPTGFDFGT
jgi:chromosome segregation ATPase